MRWVRAAALCAGLSFVLTVGSGAIRSESASASPLCSVTTTTVPAPDGVPPCADLVQLDGMPPDALSFVLIVVGAGFALIVISLLTRKSG